MENPEKFRDRYRIPSNRLQGWDYSHCGAYFITIVTHDRQHLFGEIVEGKMVLNEIGEIVKTEFIKSFEMRNELHLGEYVIMPNHIHAIVILDDGGINGVWINGVGMRGVGTRGVGMNGVGMNGVGTRGVGMNGVGTRGVGTRGVETHGRASLQSPTPSPSPSPSPTPTPTPTPSPSHPQLYRAPESISSFVAGFKSAAVNRVDDWIDSRFAETHGRASQYDRFAETHGRASLPKFNKQNPMWQANYHDHIIRNETEYRRIAEYIINNPMKWAAVRRGY